MGSPVLSGATLLSVLLYLCSVWTQELGDRDAICNEDSCLVFYQQRKIFLEAWRSCKGQGGNLVTIKSLEEATMVETLFSNMHLTEDQRIRMWIGLQRQPRKCSPGRPMRGFSWITGEQDNFYTNWEQEDTPNTCSVPRCVSVSYTTAAQERHNNLKWKDGPCSVPLDGYLCRYAFVGMCRVIRSEGDGNVLYTTPFDLVSAFLTYIPFGSIATIPCPTRVDQTVLCTHREDGTVGWNVDPPFCSDEPKTGLCHSNNGGCHHKCIEEGSLSYYCECNEGFILAEDERTCVLTDPCQDSPCEFECLEVMGSYRCACPEGYMLAPDDQHCMDVDECLQSPCEHICVNAQGSFECHCREGYQLDEDGMCEDIDECGDFPCEHDCENVMGSYICHCRLGFAPLQEEPSRCYDVDECQFKETCEQMCINHNGGFECYCEEGYELHPNGFSCVPVDEDNQSPTVTVSYPWMTHIPGWSNWETDYDQDFLTEPPDVETVSTDLLWVTNTPQEEAETTTPTESPPGILKEELMVLGPLTVSVEAFILSTTSTPLPEYYEDESTAPSTMPPTTTGAGDDLMLANSPPKEYEDLFYNYESKTPEPELLPYTQVMDEDTKDVRGSEQTQSSSWLLIGLLVPLCILIVVMVVLGTIYCTRCTQNKPQNKNATDCYHWIAGAGDKAAADMSGGGMTKV